MSFIPDDITKLSDEDLSLLIKSMASDFKEYLSDNWASSSISSGISNLLMILNYLDNNTKIPHNYSINRSAYNINMSLGDPLLNSDRTLVEFGGYYLNSSLIHGEKIPLSNALRMLLSLGNEALRRVALDPETMIQEAGKIPGSDRIVRIDHNQITDTGVVGDINALKESVRGDNMLHHEIREATIAELDIQIDALKKPSLLRSTLSHFVKVLKWIILILINSTAKELASRIVSAIEAIIRSTL